MEAYKYLMSAPHLAVCVFALRPERVHAAGCRDAGVRGESAEFGRRGAASPSASLCLGQYKTSLLGCHRKFVLFLLHLAAILLDKHCSRLVRFKHFH